MHRSLKLIFFSSLLILFTSESVAQKIITWSGDTTINGDKISVTVSYPIDSGWEITLQSDKINQANEDYNEATFPALLFQLSNSFDSTANDRRLEGTMSNDSSSIACTLFITDSISFPITLYKGEKKFKEGTIRSYLPYLSWWLGAWLIFSLLMLLYFKKSKKTFSASSNDLVAIPGNEWLLKILPIVRVSCKKNFFNRQRVLIIYKDFIFLFYKNQRKNIDELHNEDSYKSIGKIKGIKNVKQIPITSIEKIEVENESSLGKVRFRIYNNGKKENFVLPGYEMPNLLKALQSLAGKRLQTNCSINFHSYGIWIKLFFVSFAAVYLYKSILQPDVGFKIIIYYLLFLVVLIYTLVLLFSSITWFMDHLERKISKPKIKKQNADLSHHEPFRSVPIAIFLKVIGALIFVFTFLFLKQQYLPSSIKNFILEFGNYFNTFLFVFGYLLVGFILNLSLAFANKNPKADQNDTRPPILYLRSFLDDRETTFQPGTWLSYFMGVDPPYYHLSKYSFITDSLFYRFNKKIYKYFYNNHPVRMLRLILGWPSDTSEQQLELFFRKKGPFVAIGKPGEKIITSGARRMYVTNEEWQSVIIDYLHKSQLVVLQPSSTEGIWWEINQSLNIVNPANLFLCMINYKEHQNAYEDFRLRFESIKGEIRLPRFIGNTREICFFRFDAESVPSLIRLRYKKFFYWPFVGSAADLHKTFEM
jgi:hypothetical protein